MSSIEVEVVKIGGSLLRSPHCAYKLNRFLANCSAANPNVHYVLLTGGGALVDSLRAIDRENSLPTESSHWRAIELMEVAARVAVDWLPGIRIVKCLQELRERIQEPGATIFVATSFLREEEPKMPGEKLEIGWHVTSDSIAARLAFCLGTGRLTLLKSVPLGDDVTVADWGDAAERGLVDGFFSRLAPSLRTIDWQTL